MRIPSIFLISLIFVSQLFVATAFGTVGSVGLESNSYFRADANGNDQVTAVSAGVDYKKKWKYVDGHIAIEARTYLNDPSFFTAYSENLYIEKTINKKHTFTLGRKMVSWSKSDDFWKQGLWTPRFLWDPNNPERYGLTGAYYSFGGKNVKFIAFGSGINEPERTFPLKVENGRIKAMSRFLFNMPSTAIVMNTPARINYKIAYPDVTELVINPSVAMMIHYKRDNGISMRTAYAYLPSNQTFIGIEAGLDAPAFVLNSTLHPQVYNHHLLGAEVGYEKKNWSVWGSFTGESPEKVFVPENFIVEPMGPAMIISWGASYKTDFGLEVKGSYLTVKERQPARDVFIENLYIPSRFSFRDAVKFQGDWNQNRRFSYRVGTLFDIENTSTLVSFDLFFDPYRGLGRDKKLIVGVGTDFFVTATGQGTIGQYQGNDRLRGTVKYVF